MNHLSETPHGDDLVLATWIERIKLGDEAAAAELVRHYEPEIRRFVRFRLTDPKLRRFLDSMDVCQSVMAKFFHRVQTERISVEHPLQLLKLLMTMARNSLLDHARKAKVRRKIAGIGAEEEMNPIPDPRPNPEELVERADLVTLVRGRLRDDEQQTLDRWLQGCGWEEMSQELGCEPDALRKRLTRAIDRASNELGLLGADDA